MLQQMRALSRSIFAKLLLGLLILAFAIWGIQGAFNGMGNNNVAEVGGRAISLAAFEREFKMVLESQQQPDRPPVSRADAIAAGLHRQVLEGLIGQEAMHAMASRLGVEAHDDDIGEAIRNIPAVQDQGNQFSQDMYNRFLQRVGYSHPEFVEFMRGNVAVQQMMLSLTAGARAPKSFGELLLAYESETRTISVAQFTAAQLGEIPAPTDEQLQAIYQELTPQLRVPEYRNVTIIVADLAAFAARANVPEANIRAAFDRESARLSTPERRSFSVVTADTEAEARTAAQRLARGEEASAIAQSLGVQALTFENQTRDEARGSVGPAVGDAIFALAASAQPAATRGALTPWVAIRLIDVTPGVAARYEDFREDIRTALANEAANADRESAIEGFTDAYDAGAAPAEAAQRSGLQVVVVPEVDERGLKRDGSPAGAPLTDPSIVRTVFETSEGEDSGFVTAPDNVEVLIYVTNVTPESTRPFAEVREALVQRYQAQERRHRMEAIGDRIVEAVHGGATLADAARAERATITARSERVNREGASRTIPAIFQVREGEAVRGVAGDGRLLLIAQVESIQREDPTEQAATVEQMRRFLQTGERGLMRSLAEAVQAAALEAGNPTRNQTLIDRAFTNPQDAAQ